MCHSTHRGGPGPFALEVGEEPGSLTGATGASVELGTISLSCLRCHLTQGQRTRQSVARGQSPTLEGGKYLALDLSDDHPLGRIDQSDWPGLVAWRRDRPFEPVPRLYRSPALAESESIECTTCHDPHSRTSAIPEPEEERVLCSGCHDPARYLLEGHTSLTCRNCHKLHGGNDVTLLAEPFTEVLCNSCHETGGPQLSARSGRPPFLSAPQGHREPPTQTCTSCHAVHE